MTPLGVKKMRRNAAALAKLQVGIDEIWTSPLLRARQTADILAEGLGLAATPQVVKGLEPGGDSAQLIRRLERRAALGGIVLVGHEPDLGQLATQLLTGSRRAAVEFKKGAVACIEVDDVHSPLRGRLHWLLAPKHMRLMT